MAILDSKLRINKNEITRDELRLIRREFEFEVKNEIIQLFEENTESITLPPNLEFVSKLGIKLDVEDRQVAPYIESPESGIELRWNQVEWDKKLEDVDYRGFLKVGTGNGKTLYSIWLQQKLQTPLLFTGTKTNYIVNFQKELKEWGLEEHSIHITDSWDGDIKPFMTVSVQLLMQNKRVRDLLYGKYGIQVGDESHYQLGGDKFRNAIYSSNNRYALMLSATPEIKEEGRFIHTAFSPNIIVGKDINKVDITVIPIQLTFPPEYSVMTGGGNPKKKAYMLNRQYLKSLYDALDYIVNVRGRQMILYADLNEVQDKYKNLCDKLSIPSKINNKGTKKHESHIMLEEFEQNKIKTLISGVGIVESISLYHLSVILDATQRKCDTIEGKSALEQLIGRLRRMNKSKCPHKKIFLDIIYDGDYEKRFQNRKKVYESIEGVTVLKPLKSNNTQFRYLLERS